MGTRNLTIAVVDGEYRLAQYGQWDGHPESVGLDVLHFLRDEMEREVLVENLRNSSFRSAEEVNAIWEAAGAKDGWASIEDSDLVRTTHPLLHRDTNGADALKAIQGRASGLVDSYSFAGDSLFCEWCYVVDFDEGTLEVFHGFNRTPLHETARFAALEPSDNGYHPVRHVLSWSLDDLPSDLSFLDRIYRATWPAGEEDELEEHIEFLKDRYAATT